MDQSQNILPWSAFAISEILPLINNALKLSDCNINSIGMLIFQGFRIIGREIYNYWSAKRQKKEIIKEIVEESKNNSV